MDEAERKSLIRSMSAGQFYIGNIYTLFQRIRRNEDTRIKIQTNREYTACDLLNFGIKDGCK